MTRLLIKYINKKSKEKDSREKYAVLSGMVCILCNVILCAVKFTAGTLTNSLSITADAINNLSDASSGAVTVFGAKLSSKPVDEEHPFGHGRAEYISALIISFFIFLMGFELGKSSVKKIIHPENVTFSKWSLIIMIAAILIKLWMAYFNSTIYKQTGNMNMKAMCRDSLSDCIATAAAIAAMLISSLTPFKRADGIIGITVAGVILAAGAGIVKEILGPLLGQPPSDELVKSINEIILDNDLILGVHDLIVHDYGPGRILASAHAEVPSDVDICKIHDIIDNAEKQIAKKLKTVICIHMDPIAVNDSISNQYKDIISTVITNYDDSFSFHDFRVVKGKENINLIFDLVTPYSQSKRSNRILQDLKCEAKKYDEKINLVVTIEHSFI